MASVLHVGRPSCLLGKYVDLPACLLPNAVAVALNHVVLDTCVSHVSVKRNLKHMKQCEIGMRRNGSCMPD